MKVFSHSLQGKRDSNEDQHIHIVNLSGENQELNPVNFIAVFDGHGGKAVTYSFSSMSIKYSNKIYWI